MLTDSAGLDGWYGSYRFTYEGILYSWPSRLGIVVGGGTAAYLTIGSLPNRFTREPVLPQVRDTGDTEVTWTWRVRDSVTSRVYPTRPSGTGSTIESLGSPFGNVGKDRPPYRPDYPPPKGKPKDFEIEPLARPLNSFPRRPRHPKLVGTIIALCLGGGITLFSYLSAESWKQGGSVVLGKETAKV